MKSVTTYEAIDGARFDDYRDCEKHETGLAVVNAILADLPAAEPEGETYVQHDRETLLSVKRRLFELVLAKYGDSYPLWKEFDPDKVHPMSGVGRVLDDLGGPLASAWRRLSCYNFDNGREYEQPYFALNPDEATTPYEADGQ